MMNLPKDVIAKYKEFFSRLPFITEEDKIKAAVLALHPQNDDELATIERLAVKDHLISPAIRDAIRLTSYLALRDGQSAMKLNYDPAQGITSSVINAADMLPEKALKDAKVPQAQGGSK